MKCVEITKGIPCTKQAIQGSQCCLEHTKVSRKPSKRHRQVHLQ